MRPEHDYECGGDEKQAGRRVDGSQGNAGRRLLVVADVRHRPNSSSGTQDNS
jgi:hypothetical protein